MSKDKKIRIGCASAFWGDTSVAASQLVNKGELDYLVFDFLAEVTMSILAAAKIKDHNKGYALDFVDQVAPLLSDIKSKGIRVLSNAGGMNPLACKKNLEKKAIEQGISLKIAVIEGDDLMEMQKELTDSNILEMETNKPLPTELLSMNAYLGANPIIAALEEDVDIIITGRCVDSALVLGPLMYEFNWSNNDYDLLAAGSLVGHIIECGAQCTGGNFTDWKKIDNFYNMGFPIVEVAIDGSFIVTKPHSTGGLVNFGTIAEQFVYEIGDPGAYILPDVICDFTNVSIKEIDKNKVSVSGAKGICPSDTYKVSATYMDGFRTIGMLVIGGGNAKEKAEITANAIIKKCEFLIAENGFSPFDDILIDILGSDSIYGPKISEKTNSKEVVLRMVLTHKNKEALIIFSKEIAQAVTGMTPGIINYLGGRPKISRSIRLFSFLIEKSFLKINMLIEGKKVRVDIPNGKPFVINKQKTKQLPLNKKWERELPLIKLAYARSGDKGDHANIGIIARRPDYIQFITSSLSVEKVKEFFSHYCEGEVIKWDIPGIGAINFLLKNSLGGGGMSSLRIDPQGKAYAQQLLDFPIKVSEKIFQEISNN